jgi:hypothetical protein
VIVISAVLGPAATGIAAVFPVSFISLIFILLPQLGGPTTARVATNALAPMLGFGALGLAMAVCALWSGLILLLHANAVVGRSLHPIP